MVPLSFAGHDFLALPEAALFWPAHGALLVADLHFEKASWYARFGQFLPPHDSAATLDMIEALVARTGARAIWSLGDSFHDADGAARLDLDIKGYDKARTSRMLQAALSEDPNQLVAFLVGEIGEAAPDISYGGMERAPNGVAIVPNPAAATTPKTDLPD
jgi:hypothetical protein